MKLLPDEESERFISVLALTSETEFALRNSSCLLEKAAIKVPGDPGVKLSSVDFPGETAEITLGRWGDETDRGLAGES